MFVVERKNVKIEHAKPSSIIPAKPPSQHLTVRQMGYIPDGLSKAEWEALKKKEKNTKNLGASGPRGYKSRSFQSFLEAKERGEADYNMPMFNAKEKLARGEIKEIDIPYMQRPGGSWDNSDIKGAKKLPWTKSDSEYDPFGANEGKFKFPWQGNENLPARPPDGDPKNWGDARRWGYNPEAKENRNYKAPKLNAAKGGEKKGPFGLW